MRQVLRGTLAQILLIGKHAHVAQLGAVRTWLACYAIFFNGYSETSEPGAYSSASLNEYRAGRSRGANAINDCIIVKRVIWGWHSDEFSHVIKIHTLMGARHCFWAKTVENKR